MYWMEKLKDGLERMFWGGCVDLNGMGWRDWNGGNEVDGDGMG